MGRKTQDAGFAFLLHRTGKHLTKVTQAEPVRPLVFLEIPFLLQEGAERPDISCFRFLQEPANAAGIRHHRWNSFRTVSGIGETVQPLGPSADDRSVSPRDSPGRRILGKLPGMQRAVPSFVGIVTAGLLAAREPALDLREMLRHPPRQMMAGRTAPDPEMSRQGRFSHRRLPRRRPA